MLLSLQVLNQKLLSMLCYVNLWISYHHWPVLGGEQLHVAVKMVDMYDGFYMHSSN